MDDKAKQELKELLEKLRIKSDVAPTLNDINTEVESVRRFRYKKLTTLPFAFFQHM